YINTGKKRDFLTPKHQIITNQKKKILKRIICFLKAFTTAKKKEVGVNNNRRQKLNTAIKSTEM
ncbi:hypothetical protein, partial [Bacillus thuringiensis]